MKLRGLRLEKGKKNMSKAQKESARRYRREWARGEEKRGCEWKIRGKKGCDEGMIAW